VSGSIAPSRIGSTSSSLRSSSRATAPATARATSWFADRPRAQRIAKNVRCRGGQPGDVPVFVRRFAGSPPASLGAQRPRRSPPRCPPLRRTRPAPVGTADGGRRPRRRAAALRRESLASNQGKSVVNPRGVKSSARPSVSAGSRRRSGVIQSPGPLSGRSRIRRNAPVVAARTRPNLPGRTGPIAPGVTGRGSSVDPAPNGRVHPS